MNNNTAKFWMITGDHNSPKVRHQTRKSAQNEIDRLAKSHPGTEFFILEAVQMVQQPIGIKRVNL